MSDAPDDTGTAVPEPAPASPREIAAATAPGRTAPPERPVLRDTPALRDTPVLRDAPQQRDPGAPTDGMHGAIDPATRAVAAAAGELGVPR